ncbi:hypothetical protein VaNZ11_005261 [Volvox africanus]|uniref:RING-type domain-containing protein n=1 Tax=Volvox africanus TaxID=51714 RepID=A0ABQ5RZX3_9CHLO|nr:hypothetical protein VaNZ11_005261 [Volvox africanus]
MPQQDQHHHQRSTWPQLFGIHFGTACVSTAWSLRNITSPRERTWGALVQDAEALLADELTVCVLLNFCCSVFGLIALCTSTLFLGRLSALETHRLQQRLFKCIMHKIVIVRVVIQPDVRDMAGWLAWLAVVAYLRGFVGAAKDRLESLTSMPGGQPGRHARGVCLLLLMMICNAAAFMVMRMMWASSIARILLCAFDTAVVAIEGLRIMLRYAVNMVDRYSNLGGVDPSAPPTRTAQDADLPGGTAAPTAAHADGGWDLGWSGKGSFQYHAELVADVLIHAVTLVHYGHVWALHGFRFHLMDFVLFLEMRGVMLSLVRRLNGHLSYRAATKHLDTTFRDVRPSDGTAIDCSICLDEIAHVAKQLPCGHVFHLSCLRAWLQQSGSENFTCPNCRQPIITDGGIATFPQPDWWIVRLWERLGMWLTLVVEPLLLMLLINITVWLGGRAQVRRRAQRAQPASVGEGFGETPGPSSRHISRGRSRTDDDDSSDLETEQKTTHEEAEEFDNFDARVTANSEGPDGMPRNAHRNNRRSTRRNNDLNPDDFDVDADIGGATAVRARRGLRGTGCGDEGGCCVAGPSASGPAAAMRSRRAGRGIVIRLEDLQEDQVVRHHGAGRRARQMTAGDDGGAETAPSAVEAARRPSALRRAQPPGELPSVSGEVLHQVSEMARRIRRTISVSIRSSWAAVASADSDGDEEVSSRRQEAHSRAADPQEGSAGGRW